MKQFWTRNKLIIICGGLLLLLGLFLRLYRLTNMPVFADEAIYIRWAQVMRAEETLRFLPLSDGKQPLFMWIVIPFLKFISDPLVAGRLVSAVCGLVTAIGIFLVTQQIFKSAKLGLIAMGLYIVSPFAVFFDRMALVDSMLTMFSVWTFYLSVLNTSLLRLDLSLITGFVIGGALLTKSPGLFYVILLPTTLLLISWPKGTKEKFQIFGKYVLLLGISVLLGIGIANILRLGPNYSLLKVRNLDYVYRYVHILQSPLSPLLSHLGAAWEYFRILGPWSLIVLFLSGAVSLFFKKPKTAVVILFWCLFPFLAVLEYGKTLTARYILFTLPFVVILAASVFTNSKKWLYIGSGIILGLMLIQSLFLDFKFMGNIQKATLPRSERAGYLEGWTSGYGIAEVAQYIKSEVKTLSQGKQIIVGTEGYFGTLPDGLQIYLNNTPQVTVIGVGLGIDRVPTPLFESKKAGNKTYLVINDSRLMVKPETIGLKLIAAYPKALQPDGVKESLLFLEVTDEAVSEK